MSAASVERGIHHTPQRSAKEDVRRVVPRSLVPRLEDANPGTASGSGLVAIGAWSSTACEDAPHGRGGTVYLRRSLAVSPDTWVCPRGYDVVAVEGDHIRAGRRETDLCTPAGRPVALGAHALERH
jgi:hypothetical protein